MYLKSLVHNKSKDFRIVNKIINIISFMESEFEIEKNTRYSRVAYFIIFAIY